MLSGFVLIYTYDGPDRDVRRFWGARFARIYPAYALSLIAAAPFFFFAVRHVDLPLFAWSKQHLAAACVLTVALLQAWVPQAALSWNSVCWSLSVEASFYGAFPLLMRWSKSWRQQWLVLGLISGWLVSLSFSLAYVFLHPDGLEKVNSTETTLFWKNVLSFHPLVRLPEFLIGVLAGRLFLVGRRESRLAPALVLGGLFGIAIVTALADKIPNPVISTGLLSPAFAAIIYGLALRPRWSSFLEARWLVLLGDASYSLYLLHSIVITKVFGAIPSLPWGIRVAVSLGAAIGASLLCYEWIEQPGRRKLRAGRRP